MKSIFKKLSQFTSAAPTSSPGPETKAPPISVVVRSPDNATSAHEKSKVAKLSFGSNGTDAGTSSAEHPQSPNKDSEDSTSTGATAVPAGTATATEMDATTTPGAGTSAAPGGHIHAATQTEPCARSESPIPSAHNYVGSQHRGGGRAVMGTQRRHLHDFLILLRERSQERERRANSDQCNEPLPDLARWAAYQYNNPLRGVADTDRAGEKDEEPFNVDEYLAAYEDDENDEGPILMDLE